MDVCELCGWMMGVLKVFFLGRQEENEKREEVKTGKRKLRIRGVSSVACSEVAFKRKKKRPGRKAIETGNCTRDDLHMRLNPRTTASSGPPCRPSTRSSC